MIILAFPEKQKHILDLMFRSRVEENGKKSKGFTLWLYLKQLITSKSFSGKAHFLGLNLRDGMY